MQGPDLKRRLGMVCHPKDAGTTSRPGTFELPIDLQDQAVDRLGAFSLAFAGLLAVSFVTRRIGIYAGVPMDMEFVPIANLTTVLLVAILVVVGVMARGHWLSAKATLKIGLVLELVASLAVAFLDRVLFDFGDPPIGLSFATIVILTFPLVVPTALAPRVITSLLSAAMVPVGVLLGSLVGKPMPDTQFLVVGLQPTLLVAILGILGSRIVYRMGVAVQQARQLGSYELVDKLGGGGMGEVWRAKHRMLIRPAAVKLIRPDRLGSQLETSVRRFEREAQATGALRSPHTVELYDFGTTEDGTFYYAMELLEGMDLDVLVKRHGAVAPGRAIHILKQVCRSLADAHERGLVHRDIKPANIFLCTLGTEPDFVKVLDFGLVKPRPGDALDVTGASVAGSPLGTPGFLPPEIALGEPVDGRADLYSLGCVAYWLLTGEAVFNDPSAMKVIMAHAQQTPESPSSRLGSALPSDLEAVVMRCLEKKPDDRPPSAAALYRDLAACQSGPEWTEDDAAGWWRSHPVQQMPLSEPVAAQA